MQRKIIDPAGFEAKFRENIDPWNYAASPFEAYKRAVLLRACGTRRYGRGLELACAIGVTTQMLAPRCLRLLAIDSSATALKEPHGARAAAAMSYSGKLFFHGGSRGPSRTGAVQAGPKRHFPAVVATVVPRGK